MTVDNDQRVCLTPAVHFISSTSPWISRGFTVGNLIPINSTHEADSVADISLQHLPPNILNHRDIGDISLLLSECYRYLSPLVGVWRLGKVRFSQ